MPPPLLLLLLNRRTYQRAIVVPTHSLELIWKNYETFENTTAAATSSTGGSAATAKTFSTRVLSEQRPRFQAARMAYRERKRKMEGIDTAALPVPPGRFKPAGLCCAFPNRCCLWFWEGFPAQIMLLHVPDIPAYVGTKG
eukprot:GHUV01044243.1.p1 GENE.GHUV01044243.1~~GHUV01044243.1.p1  ORF type:complete len:140 (+),score=22.95 GHUV01044243.1:193-612(+)